VKPENSGSTANNRTWKYGRRQLKPEKNKCILSRPEVKLTIEVER
jgi:hypothetical protein